jgi:hypothetical protein
MSRALKINLLAVAFALIAAVIGYSVPVLGYVVVFCLALILVSVLLGDGSAAADLMAPLVAFGRWLAAGDDFRWLRRAPLFGVLAGTVAKWVLGETSRGGWM